jgi:hypothetical protein
MHRLSPMLTIERDIARLASNEFSIANTITLAFTTRPQSETYRHLQR